MYKKIYAEVKNSKEKFADILKINEWELHKKWHRLTTIIRDITVKHVREADKENKLRGKPDHFGNYFSTKSNILVFYQFGAATWKPENWSPVVIHLNRAILAKAVEYSFGYTEFYVVNDYQISQMMTYYLNEVTHVRFDAIIYEITNNDELTEDEKREKVLYHMIKHQMKGLQPFGLNTPRGLLLFFFLFIII